MVALVLGSASPRRAQLLTQLGLEFETAAADIDETPELGEAAIDYVERMAREKAVALAHDHADSILLTADTTVILDGEALGKPRDHNDARRMLQAMSGRTHTVCTALFALSAAQRQQCCVQTTVEMIDLSPALVDAYLATDEPWDKAGAYGIQGLAGSFVRRIDGSVTNVIGLPQAETRELLARMGIQALVAGAVL